MNNKMNVGKSNNDPFVTVIIPTFNRKEYLLEAVKSVLDQTYKNLEIIIVDDGSTDGSKEAIKNLNNDKISYIWQKNSGLPSVARNTGIKQSKGDYIAFLDSDDLWVQEKLEFQIQLLLDNPKLLGISSNMLNFSFKENSKPYVQFDYTMNFCPTFFSLLKGNVVANSSVVIRKDVINHIGLLDENKLIRGVEDYDYWLRILAFRDRSILVIANPLIKYRIHDENIFISEYSVGKRKSMNIYLNKLFYIYKKYKCRPLIYKFMIENKIKYLKNVLHLIAKA
jgi:glycosyltransferase involved in cell wall biosynthesis